MFDVGKMFRLLAINHLANSVEKFAAADLELKIKEEGAFLG